MKKKNGTISKELMQLLLNVVIIGIFSMIENWLLFYYSCSEVLPGIFAVLKLMVCCLFVINLYDMIKASSRREDTERDRQIQMLLYKEIQKLNEKTETGIAEVKEDIGQQMEELRKDQLRSAKAVWDKLDNISSGN